MRAGSKEEGLLTQATTKLAPCQVRSKTGNPCLRQAVEVIGGIPFCEACVREQEAYFAIGELTQEFRSKPLGKMLGEALCRRERLALTNS